jgi:RNA-binding protein YlmH
VLPQHQLTQISQDQFQIQFLDVDNKPKFITWQDMDFHAMGKKYLGDIVANPC